MDCYDAVPHRQGVADQGVTTDRYVEGWTIALRGIPSFRWMKCMHMFQQRLTFDRRDRRIYDLCHRSFHKPLSTTRFIFGFFLMNRAAL